MASNLTELLDAQLHVTPALFIDAVCNETGLRQNLVHLSELTLEKNNWWENLSAGRTKRWDCRSWLTARYLPEACLPWVYRHPDRRPAGWVGPNRYPSTLCGRCTYSVWRAWQTRGATEHYMQLRSDTHLSWVVLSLFRKESTCCPMADHWEYTGSRPFRPRQHLANRWRFNECKPPPPPTEQHWFSLV